MPVTITVTLKDSTRPSEVPGIAFSLRQLDSVAKATVNWGDEPDDDDEEDDNEDDEDDWYADDKGI